METQNAYISVVPTDTSQHWRKFFSVATVCFFWLVFFAGGMAAWGADDAHAASLYFAPQSGTHTVGQNFSLSVFVSSPEEAMNAVSGVIHFPVDRLQVTGISKGGSVVTLWVQEPSFSNTNGTVSFEGITLNPGYTGTGGKILSVTFKGASPGLGALSFSSGSVLANDGQGTDILSGLGTAQVTLVSAEAPEEKPEPEKPSGVPLAPVVSSPTHLDPQAWYPHDSPSFAWDVPTGISGMSFRVDRNPETDPGETSDGLVQTYTFQDMDDGAWYFHIRFRNSTGWGGITHRPFHIDAMRPAAVRIQEIAAGSFPSGARFFIEADDATSGIASYDIALDHGMPVRLEDGGYHIYTTPALDAGMHTLSVTAFDRAGNSLEAEKAFEISGVRAPLQAERVDIFQLALALMILPSLLMLGLLFALAYIWREIVGMKRRITYESRALLSAYDEQVQLLERARKKRELTAEEKQILAQAKRDIAQAKAIKRKRTRKNHG
ncbi:MAG: cohesin domain-containing protein [Patescibacteria group bacterium]